MNKRVLSPIVHLFFLAVLISVGLPTFAQEQAVEEATEASDSIVVEEPKISFEYTYDREQRYSVIHELNGEIFVPGGVQEGNGKVQYIEAGDVVIKLNKGSVNIVGISEEWNSFELVQKRQDVKLGYVYELMDQKARPAVLKIVLDEDKFVQLLYFQSKAIGEYTFYLPQRTAEEESEDEAYYTFMGEYFYRDYSNLVDKKIVPYKMIKNVDQTNIPERIPKSKNYFFEFKDDQVTTPLGTFPIKRAKTFAYRLPGHDTVRFMIEVELKDKIKYLYIFLDYKSEIYFMEIDNARFFLRN